MPSFCLLSQSSRYFPRRRRRKIGTHLNGVVDLIAAHKPVFGVYAPRNPRARPGGAPMADSVRQKTSTELAEDALGYTCKEFNVPCGYPATANDIETRMQQGFSVFVIGWGDQGFKAVDIGRRIGNRGWGIGNRDREQ